MWILVCSLAALFVVALVAGRLRATPSRHEAEGEATEETPAVRRQRPEGCCGLHEVCEKEKLLAAVADTPDYYEDEELDAFSGRASDSYTAAETDAFEEVMTTMRPDEVAGWLRSLQLRGINLPDALKDEAVLLMEG